MFIHFEFQVGFWNYEAKTKKHTGEIIFILKTLKTDILF